MASDKVMMGLDIGSAWIRAAVGSLSTDGQLMVDALCEIPSEGVRNGAIVNFEQTYKNIYSVIQEAELQSGQEIQVCIAGIGGENIIGRQSEGVAGITTKGLEITNSDIFRSLEVARAFNLPAERQILHTLVQDFSVDGRRDIRDPLDMTGHRLESRALVVTALASQCMNVKKCIQKAGVNNSRLVLSTLADAEVVLCQDEKEMGTILINIGANCTDVIAYQHGYPVYAGGVDFGGASVTNDIFYLLSKPKQVAEQIKCENGSCYSPAVKPDDKVIIPAVGGVSAIQMPKIELSKIIEPRMAEIFSILQNDLLEHKIEGSFGGGIVIVGGGSLLSGVTDLAQEVFDVPARIGFPEALPGLDRSFINPKYTTVLGLLKSEAKKYTSSVVAGKKTRNRDSQNKSGFFHALGNFFKTVV